MCDLRLSDFRPTDSGKAAFPLDAAFFDTGLLTGQITQVVQFCAANLTVAVDLDLIDIRAVQRENTLNTFTVGDTANRDRLSNSGTLAGNYRTGIKLNTLFSALFNLVVDADGIADNEVGMTILIGVFLSDFLNSVHKTLSLMDLFKERQII